MRQRRRLPTLRWRAGALGGVVAFGAASDGRFACETSRAAQNGLGTEWKAGSVRVQDCRWQEPMLVLLLADVSLQSALLSTCEDPYGRSFLDILLDRRQPKNEVLTDVAGGGEEQYVCEVRGDALLLFLMRWFFSIGIGRLELILTSSKTAVRAPPSSSSMFGLESAAANSSLNSSPSASEEVPVRPMDFAGSEDLDDDAAAAGSAEGPIPRPSADSNVEALAPVVDEEDAEEAAAAAAAA
eukprot:CAMPEP_0206605726 /NCGR_PEP_ID=MMETSP0325_2-20121206/50648_1 /ASSEMBLY_ACC=CAM_ASM_000347 /TAXON_ID=2866 /ORGANISM="Crypthecodinium cohnii, Strain Seligo" /LENGTH=240 /DNA_ID=CAMNT_0054121447 /DNA_START=71 /DNA_END=791 /DNA_ORIENTATION=+